MGGRQDAQGKELLESLGVTTGGLHKTSPPPPIARMFLTYKNALKCILVPGRSTKVTRAVPRNFASMPSKGYGGGWGRSGGVAPAWGGGIHGKIRLTQCILEYPPSPPLEEGVCCGGGSGRRYHYARFPFGWSYSPAICQQLVMAMIRRVLSPRGLKGWVYLDDILLFARRKGRLRRAVRDCIARLCGAGFIVGDKSETTPTECISFVGKSLDTRDGTIGNAVGALVGAFRAWVRGMGRGCLPKSAMERLLGKLCWLGRPNASLGAFLASAYVAMQRGLGRFGWGVAKGVATVLMFSCVAQAADPLGERTGPT